MLDQLRRSAILCLVCLVLFGLAYPLLGVGLSQLGFVLLVEFEREILRETESVSLRMTL